MEVFSFVISIFKTVQTLKDAIVLGIIIILLYAIISGKNLLSRVIQLFIIIYICKNLYKGYIISSLLETALEMVSLIVVLFAPNIVRLLYRIIKASISWLADLIKSRPKNYSYEECKRLINIHNLKDNINNTTKR